LTAQHQSADADDFIEVRDLVAGYDGKVVVDTLSFEVKTGEHVSLLGPSGCGKSTTLRCIAGLETPLSGEIRIGGTVMFSSARRINLPPEKRNLAMVFQSYAIWPHMTVFENVAYGLRARRHPKAGIRPKVEHAVEMVGMSAFIDRPATALSGGQQQRVALARAYATAPAAILLDEPLSNLDARLRIRMREEMKELQARMRLSTLYVTHDQEEAMAMSDRIVVMREGLIEQQGKPLDIYESPRTRFVADFLGGANVLTGKFANAEGTLLQVKDATIHCRPTAGVGGAGCDAWAAVHTSYPTLAQVLADNVNVWPAKILRRDLLGEIVAYRVSWPGGELRVTAGPKELFVEGESVQLSIAPEFVKVLVE
jgi:ABC-type Fe3+/spermidine/putrescine transport system ATPase subunit